MAKQKGNKPNVPFEQDEATKGEMEKVDEREESNEKEEKKITKGRAKNVAEVDMQVIKDLQKEIAELKKQVSVSDVAAVSEDDLIKEDYMEEPAVFFAFSSYYGIYGDTRKGHSVSTPYERPFQFKRLYRTTKPSLTGRGVEIITVSQCVVRSKREYEWLKKHSLFNIKFFESIEKAKNVDVVLAEKMGEANAVVSKMSDHQCLDRAQRENIDIVNPDISNIRKLLTYKMAKDLMDAEKRKVEVKLRASRDEHDRVIENKKEIQGVDEVY